jgi:hypothetical protein
MWTFSTDRRAPQLAHRATYAALFELWARTRHRETVPTYQLGYLQAGPGARRRGRPPLPLLQLLPEPGGSLDFADPLSGFPGLERPPAAERVLTIWADDLVSVHHGHQWIFVVDADRPLTVAWLDLLRRRAAAGRHRPYAVVTATFGGPAPSGPFRVSDLDATTYSTLVHVDDRRSRPAGPEPVGQPAPGRSR